MRTVLGLSKTSTSIGWVLVDAEDAAGDPLDHDAFDVTGASSADPAATARRARAIATATGYTVDCVRVTSSDHVGANAVLLRKALAESGFDNIVSVPLTAATQAWAKGVGLADGQEKVAVCILDRGSVFLSMIDVRNGATKTETTNSSGSATLINWLTTAFGRNGPQPESLYLIGSRSELDAIAGPLDEGLSIPVMATRDAQVALARGAAFSDAKHVDDVVVASRPRSASHALTLTGVAAVALASLFTLSSAGGPIRLVDRDSQQAAMPTPPRAAEIPVSPAPIAPLFVLPPPTAVAPEPVPEEPAAAFLPEPAPVVTDTALPETVATPVAETVPVAPPVQHLPEVQPVQHIPETQPAGAPAAQAPAAPGPVAPAPMVPAPAAPIPPPSETIPPPPPDPIGQLLFGGLP